MTWQLSRAEGQHKSQQAETWCQPAVLFSGSFGENLVPHLLQLLEAAFIAWFLATVFTFEASQGRWSPPLTFLQSLLPLTRARRRYHLQAHQIVQVHQPLSRLSTSSHDHNRLFSNINSQQPQSPWP